MLNHIVICGHIGTDLELRYTGGNNTPFVSFTVAVDRDYCKEGEDRKTDWIRVVAWRELAKFITDHFHKGKLITVDGRMQEGRYTDRNGNEHRTYELMANHAYFCGDGGKKQERTSSLDEGSELPF